MIVQALGDAVGVQIEKGVAQSNIRKLTNLTNGFLHCDRRATGQLIRRIPIRERLEDNRKYPIPQVYGKPVTSEINQSYDDRSLKPRINVSCIEGKNPIQRQSVLRKYGSTE